MKKLFLNPRFLHGFYMSLIMMLGYAMYAIVTPTKEQKSNHTVGQTLERSNHLVQSYNHAALRLTETQCKMYNNGSNKMNLSQAKEMDSLVFSLYEQISIFQKNNISLNINDIGFLNKNILNLRSKISSYFELQKWHKDIVIKTDTILYNVQSQLIENSPNLFAQLEGIKSQLLMANTCLQNYYAMITSNCGGGFYDNFTISILPSQFQIVQGKPSIFDLCFTDFFPDIQPKTIIEQEGKQIFANSYGHFTTRFSNAGLHTIKAISTFKNPKTLEIEQITKEFSINVYPK